MDVQTYEDLLKGNLVGKSYCANTFFIKNKKNKKQNKQESIVELTKTDLSPPANLNRNTTIKNNYSNNKQKKSGQSIDPKVLRTIFSKNGR